MNREPIHKESSICLGTAMLLLAKFSISIEAFDMFLAMISVLLLVGYLIPATFKKYKNTFRWTRMLFAIINASFTLENWMIENLFATIPVVLAHAIRIPIHTLLKFLSRLKWVISLSIYIYIYKRTLQFWTFLDSLCCFEGNSKLTDHLILKFQSHIDVNVLSIWG